VLVPNYPGITAALGLLTTDLVYEYTKTAYVMCSSLTGDAKASANLEKQFAALEKEAMRQFAVDKIDKKRIRLERIVDARYEGQGYELRVDAPRTGVDDKWIKAVKNEFHAAHEKEFSRRFEDVDVQIANIRVRAIGEMPGLKPVLVKKGTATPPKGALKLTADAWFEKNGKPAKFKTKFYERTELLAGNKMQGPAIITQFDSTSVVPPGYSAEVDKHGNLIIKYSAAVAKAAESGH
jgi:N-methylhydantoinase A/oxoprolinase/acetone carboxylase beta subunit